MSRIPYCFHSVSSRLTATAFSVAAAALILSPGQAFAQEIIRKEQVMPVHGSLSRAIAVMPVVGPVQPETPVNFAIKLPLRNQADLTSLVKDLYDPKSPRFGQFLKRGEFAAKYGPTQADYDKVIAFARASGFTIEATHPGRTLLTVSGPASSVQRAFSVTLQTHQDSATGKNFLSADREASVPASLSSAVSGIIGLSDTYRLRPNHIVVPASQHKSDGTGQGNDLSPTDIKTAYGLNGVTLDGTGQTLGLVEFEQFKAGDVTAYEDQYGLPHVPLEVVPVHGGSPPPSVSGDGIEATLDIDMQVALAPNASKIIVYEAPNGEVGDIDLYTWIAEEDSATSISSSWGLPEPFEIGNVADAEYDAFLQMAAQGQTMCVASGDVGSWSDLVITTTDFIPPYVDPLPSVQDPSSQPFVTGVGGTLLTTATPGGAYKSETAWGYPTAFGGGGGGGISTFWSIPAYQVGAFTAASNPQGSLTFRNVPDVSLNADPDNGYSIFFTDIKGPGSFIDIGGTSAASPLWSALVALANQKRAAAGLGPIGFLNPALYGIGTSRTSYAADFNDINDLSTNAIQIAVTYQYLTPPPTIIYTEKGYSAVNGYDNATGWGSFIGGNLINDLAAYVQSPSFLSFSPLSGVIGTPVTISGQNLIGATAVNFGTTPATFTVVSPTTITTTVPTGASSDWITVTTPGGTATSPTFFTVIPAPATPSFVPAAGTPGTLVTISGGNFTGKGFTTNTISFNGTPATAFTIVSPTKITATVPSGATTGKVSVTTNGGTAASKAAFSITPIKVTAMAFNPATVKTGTIATGSLTLTAAAPAGGAVLTVSHGGAVVATATVAAGSKTATFSLPKASTATAGTFAFVAVYGSSSVRASLIVTK